MTTYRLQRSSLLKHCLYEVLVMNPDCSPNPVLSLRIQVQTLRHFQYIPLHTLITCTALDLMPHRQRVWLFTQQVPRLQANAV